MKEFLAVLAWCLFCYLVPYLIGQVVEPLAMMFLGGILYFSGLEWYARRVARKGLEGG